MHSGQEDSTHLCRRIVSAHIGSRFGHHFTSTCCNFLRLKFQSTVNRPGNGKVYYLSYDGRWQEIDCFIYYRLLAIRAALLHMSGLFYLPTNFSPPKTIAFLTQDDYVFFPAFVQCNVFLIYKSHGVWSFAIIIIYACPMNLVPFSSVGAPLDTHLGAIVSDYSAN